MLYVAAILLITGAILFTLYVREQDLPATEPASPFAHLEDRKAQIYENLRDLQFEYRVGKLSDADYQKTKLELQSELAKTLAEIDKHAGAAAPKASPAPVKAAVATAAPAETKYTCPHCKASFDRALKFCGECGKAMAGDAV